MAIQQSRVHSLVDHNSHSWNHQVIAHCFDYATAQSILKTPLIQQVEEDKLIWKVEKNGHYSVRSAYRLCMEEIADNSYLHRPGYWTGVWKLKAPPKVKNLIWKIVEDVYQRVQDCWTEVCSAHLCVRCVRTIMRMPFMRCLIAQELEMYGVREICGKK